MTERQALYVELTELVLRASEGDLDAAGHARLESLLEDDAQARADYADLMMTVCSLDWRAGADTHAARAADSAIGQVLLTGVIERQREEQSRRMLAEEERLRLLQADAELRRLSRPAAQPALASDHRVIVIPKAVAWLGIAAVIGLVATLVWHSATPEQTPSDPVVVEDRPRLRDTPVAGDVRVRVARVVAALDAQWADGRSVQPGASVYDQPIELASGIIEMELTNGVTLTLEAPARLVPASDMLVTLDRGKLVGQVPVQAHGFTVRTDTMDVVDLGTEFAVESGGTRGSAVHVLDGEIRLEPGRSAQSFEPVVASAGGALMVRAGLTPEAIAVRPSAFYRHVPSPYERMVREADPLMYLRFDRLDNSGQLLGLGSAGLALPGLRTMDLSDDVFPGGESTDRSLWLSRRRRLSLAPLVGFDVRAGLSLEAWVYVPTETDRRMRIISNNELRSDGSHAGGFGLGVSGDPVDWVGGPVVQFTGFSVFDAYSRTTVPTDQWVHLAVTLDAEGRLSMYIDGELVSYRVNKQADPAQHPGYDGSMFVPHSDGAVLVGDALIQTGNRSEHWVGGLDEVAVYDYVLDAEEIVAHAASAPEPED